MLTRGQESVWKATTATDILCLRRFRYLDDIVAPQLEGQPFGVWFSPVGALLLAHKGVGRAFSAQCIFNTHRRLGGPVLGTQFRAGPTHDVLHRLAAIELDVVRDPVPATRAKEYREREHCQQWS